MPTAAITIAGITKTVELDPYGQPGEKRAMVTGSPAVAIIGRGVARYPVSLMLWAIKPDARPGSYTHRDTMARSGQLCTDSDGREWGVALQTCVRNRQARIVAWDSELPATNHGDNARA